jgi:hypothetical protein
MMDEDVPDLGCCCACGTTDSLRMIRNIVMLPVRAPVAGTGWGCLHCGLPQDGALAVVCDPCLESNQEIIMVASGQLGDKQRMPRSALADRPFDHDRSKHPEEYDVVDEEPDDDDPEAETYLCQLCGTVSPRPAIVVFAGESVDDPDMAATEICSTCWGFLGRAGAVGGAEVR